MWSGFTSSCLTGDKQWRKGSVQLKFNHECMSVWVCVGVCCTITEQKKINATPIHNLSCKQSLSSSLTTERLKSIVMVRINKNRVEKNDRHVTRNHDMFSCIAGCGCGAVNSICSTNTERSDIQHILKTSLHKFLTQHRHMPIISSGRKK